MLEAYPNAPVVRLCHVMPYENGGFAGSLAPLLFGGPGSLALNALTSKNMTLQPAHS
jgi:hypothetical protein